MLPTPFTSTLARRTRTFSTLPSTATFRLLPSLHGHHFTTLLHITVLLLVILVLGAGATSTSIRLARARLGASAAVTDSALGVVGEGNGRVVCCGRHDGWW